MRTIVNDELSELLVKSFDDLVLSNSEKYDLVDVIKQCSGDQIRYLKNQAFDIYREFLFCNKDEEEKLTLSLRWLEKTISTLFPAEADTKISQAYFSPGDACRDKIISLCNSAVSALEICVFTISDDRITSAILAAHQRGATVRIISDQEKSKDDGSDIKYLQQAGVPIKLDNSEHHMHHKFGIVDGSALINGSFNWTRSASEYNNENIVVTYENRLINEFSAVFEALWSTM